MAVPQNHSPEAAYLTKPNIVHPESGYSTQRGDPAQLVTQGDAKVTAAEALARQHIADRTGLTVSGSSIKKGK